MISGNPLSWETGANSHGIGAGSELSGLRGAALNF